MNREDFLDTIRKQYADEIHEAYIECAHEAGNTDWSVLNGKLSKLMRSAKAEGLPNKDFVDLVQSTLPAEARGFLTFDSVKKAA